MRWIERERERERERREREREREREWSTTNSCLTPNMASFKFHDYLDWCSGFSVQ